MAAAHSSVTKSIPGAAVLEDDNQSDFISVMTFIEHVLWSRCWAKHSHFSHLSLLTVPGADAVIPIAPGRRKQAERPSPGTQACHSHHGLPLYFLDSSHL